MAKSYLSAERDQLFLLPPDMQEWLPEGHLARFVVDVLDRLDTSVLHARRRVGGVGRRGHDPDMMLALLVYAYCTGQRSSRQIERLCEVDIAYRFLTGGHLPDHTTIARFRQDHEDQAARLFTDALVLCAEAGLASLGVVAVDGTKIAADAGLRANRTRESIEAEVRGMLAQAAEVDAEQDRLFGEDRGDELPQGLREAESRGARLDAALQVIAERERAVQAQAADAKAWVDAAWARAAEGKGMSGRPPAGVDEVTLKKIQLERVTQRAVRDRQAREARAAAQGRPAPERRARRDRRVPTAEAAVAEAEQRAAEQPTAGAAAVPDDDHERRPRANVTDPDSRTMSTSKGWVQGYNGQAAVNEHGVVVAADVTQDHNDVNQLVPMIAAILHQLQAAGIDADVGVMLFDAGYWSEDNATAEGPGRLIATKKDHKRRKQLREQGTVTGPPPPGATPEEAMEHRLSTAEGAALYAKRAVTVEPVFGQHKHNRGFRRFSRRGLAAAKAEWLLINATHNLLKAFGHITVAQPTIA